MNFYVIVGSPAGTVIGLQFVVVSLITDMPTARADAEAGGAGPFPTSAKELQSALLVIRYQLSNGWSLLAGFAETRNHIGGSA